MKSRLLLTILSILFCLQSAIGQVQTYELSYWLKDFQSNKIKSNTVLGNISLSAGDSLSLKLLNQPKILDLRIKEGRLKRELLYKQSSDHIKLELPADWRPSMSIYIAYELLVDSLESQGALVKGSDFLVMNPFNVNELIGSAVAGYHYPVGNEESAQFKLNVSIPRASNIGYKADLDFVVNEKNQKSFFYKSTKKLLHKDFYLVVGEFKKFDEEDFEEDVLQFLVELSPAKIRRDRVKRTYKELLGFYQKYDSSLDMENMVEIDSLLEIGVQPKTKLENIEVSQWEASQMLVSKIDSTLGFRSLLLSFEWLKHNWTSEKYTEWIKTNYASNNLESYLEDQAEYLMIQWASEFYSVSFDSIIMNPNYNWKSSLDSNAHSFVKGFLQNKTAPIFSSSYRYLNAQSQQLVKLRMDTTTHPAYPIPFRLTIQGNEEKDTVVFSSDTINSDILINYKGAPKYVHLEPLGDFPFEYEERMPNSYKLYAYNQEKDEEKKREILIDLLQTDNKNLKSTLLGIAMRSENESLVLIALSESEDLDILAQKKLKANLQRLSETASSEEIRKKAKLLCQKYY